jgi:hypothetical protein
MSGRISILVRLAIAAFAAFFLAGCMTMVDIGRALSPTSRAPASDAGEETTPSAKAAPPSVKPSGTVSSAPAVQIPKRPYPDYPEREAFLEIARRYSRLPGPSGAAVSAALERMEAGTVLKGSCWDFCNAVYVSAGFQGKGIQEAYSSAESGPYADPSILLPGDWISSRNIYSATVNHASIFIEWLDMEARTALVIDYPGNSRAEPGRFRVSDLTKTYKVMRGKL